MSSSTPPQSDAHRENSWPAIIARARQGCRESFNTLARGCWAYLNVAAREQLPPDLNTKVAPSDLVQQTLLVGYANFQSFAGESEADLLRWLQAILRRQALMAGRFHRNTASRSIDREVPLKTPLHAIPDSQLTPSHFLVAADRISRLQSALQQLPEHYRHTLILRNQEGLSFEEIGRRTDRSADAARKVWVAALRSLKDLLSQDSDFKS